MAAHGSVSQDSTDSRQVNSSKMTFEAASSSDKTDYGAKMSSDKMDKERKLSLDKTDYGAKMSSDKMDRERKLSSDKTDYERKLSSDKMLSEPSMSSYKTELKSGSLDSAGKTEKAPAVPLQTCEPAPQPSSVSASASMTYGSVGRDVTHSLPLLPSPHRSSLGSAYGRESKRSSLPRSFSLSRKSARKAHVRELTEIKGVLEDTLRSKEEQISYLRSQLTQLEHEKVEMSEQVKELQQCQHLQSELQQRHQAITKQNAEYEMMIEHLERRQEEFLQVDSAKSDAIAVCDSHIQELTRIVGENREQLSRYQRQQEEKEKELLALDASHKQTIDTLKANVDRLTAMLRKSDVNHVKRQPGGMEVGEDVLDEDGNILVRSVDDLQKNLSKMSKRVEEYEKFNSCFKEQLEAKERELEEREAQHQELEYSLREEVERLRTWKTQQQEQVHVREKLVSDLNKNVEEKSITIKDYERLISSLQTRHKQQVEELSNKLEAERQEREKEREVGDCEIALLTKQLEKAHQELRKSTATTQHSRGRSGSYKRDERDSSQVASLSGLPNLGNTCYINSIIQCLYSINTLRDYLTHDEFRKYINSKSEQKGKVVLAVAQVFKALSSGAVKDIFKKINSLKNVIEDLDEEFRGSHQHDAHDLLAGLLTWLHNDLVKLNDSSSIISKLFNIEHESVITCDKNKQVICCTKEVFSNLTLSVSEGNAQLLQDLLNKHYAQRKISWDCHFCGQEHLCNHDMKIVHLPPVLFIHLSRYSSQGPKGKKTQVLFPAEDLSLKEHMKLGSTSPCYEVCSVVRHKGTMTAGHYTAYCRSHRNGSDGWHFFDDDLVSSTDLDTILQLATAHILVYTQMK
ncbi:hypothetical protein OTU49_013890 [Cherax quadricarinatus]|uniref:USP domain-containing protein n=2 Tax=Cherax quadricarinatus TaxID=27406 RepID=A0AAW0VRC3_CHEQU